VGVLRNVVLSCRALLALICTMLFVATTPAGAQITNLTLGHGQVMATPIQVYLIYWLPSGAKFDPSAIDGVGNYEVLTAGFFSNVSNTNYFGILPQYSSPDAQIVNDSSSVMSPHSWADTAPYSQFNSGHNGSSIARAVIDSNTVAISDVRQEVLRAIKQNGWTPGASALFVLFTGNQINVCGSDLTGISGCSYSAFCGYHQNFTDANGTSIHYAVVVPVCNGEGLSTPVNGQLVSDRAVAVESHEFFESVTDPIPFGGWNNGQNGGLTGEIGDLCNSAGRDVALASGQPFWVQAQWSNATRSCEPRAGPAIPVCEASVDCANTLSVTCTGEDVGVIDPNGNCFDASREHTACVAGFTGASSVTAGGNVYWFQSPPNSGAEACTMNRSGTNCVELTPTTPATGSCQTSLTGTPPRCFSGLYADGVWCARLNRCVTKSEAEGECALTRPTR
jgi:hypothetical protein